MESKILIELRGRDMIAFIKALLHPEITVEELAEFIAGPKHLSPAGDGVHQQEPE